MNERFFKLLFHRIPNILKLLLVISITIPLFGYLIYLIEPETFPSFFDGVWWAVVTGATVGYGDYVPTTTLGRMLALCLILSGGGLIAFYIATLSTAAIKRNQKAEQGKISFHGRNHYILIGFNERSRQLIDLIIQYYPDKKIVIIDESLSELSYSKLPVHFIKGNAAEDAILHKANVEHASYVFISADQQKSDYESDSHTILITIAVRGNNQTVPIVSEILSKKQIDNAVRAGATTIIRSNDFMSSLFFHELEPGMHATPFEDIYHLLTAQKFIHQPVPASIIGTSYQASIPPFLEKGYLILGVYRQKDYILNPDPSFAYQSGDILITITNRSFQ